MSIKDQSHNILNPVPPYDFPIKDGPTTEETHSLFKKKKPTTAKTLFENTMGNPFLKKKL